MTWVSFLQSVRRVAVMTWVSFLQSLVPPTTHSVERDPGAGTPNPAPLFSRPDPFSGLDHGGSDDLEQFPPSDDERALARRHLAPGVGVAVALFVECQSIARAQAVLRLVRSQERAAAVLERVDGRCGL